MAKAKATLATASDFVRAKELVTMPDAPVKVIIMPEFQQGVAVAYDDPPGPLEKRLANYYAISPIPDDWSDEQATSFLREYNDYMIHDLTVHEAMPGHYLQLVAFQLQPVGAARGARIGAVCRRLGGLCRRHDGRRGLSDGDPLFKLTVLKIACARSPTRCSTSASTSTA